MFEKLFNKSETTTTMTPETIYASALETEKKMNDLLVELHKEFDPNYIAIENLLISYMYTTCIPEDVIYDIFRNFCNTQKLPAMSMIPGFNNHSKLNILTGGIANV